MRARGELVTLMVAAVAHGAAHGVSAQHPAIEDVIGLRKAANPVISPDGKAIVYTVTVADWARNEFDSELWVARVGQSPRQLTRNEQRGSDTPRWSPEGDRLAFVTDRGNGRQVHVLSLSGGEALPITNVSGGVGDFAWSPDGGRVAFTTRDPESEDLRRRSRRYGQFRVVDADYRMTHLWVIGTGDLGHGFPEPTRLTEGATFTVGRFAWSPDGTRIAFDHQPDPSYPAELAADISVIDVSTKTVRPLVARTGEDRQPVWSPDGRWVLFLSGLGDTLYFRNRHLAKVDVARGTIVPLAVAIDENKLSPAWNSRGIWFLADRGVKRQLYRLDPETGRSQQVSTTPDVVWTASFSRDGALVAFDGESPTTMTEIHWSRTDTWTPETITAITRQTDNWSLGTREMIRWKSRDGAAIEGALFKPSVIDPSKRYPLLVMLHGGPAAISRPQLIPSYRGPGWVYPIVQWLEKGALVLMPNYRGSSGQGQAFRSLNVRNLGVGDAWDVLSGVDELVRRGMADSTRMGAMGWSQGGYIAAFLTTTTDRFKAMSVGAGISDWTTYYANTDAPPFTRHYLGATPWDDPAIYAKTSPITYLKQARTPTLIQHGEFDRRVPPPNAYELYRGLLDVRVPTQLVIYRGFDHAIDKPRELAAATWHNWQWFLRYVWGEVVDLPVDR